MPTLFLLLVSGVICSASWIPFYSNPSYERDEPTDPPWWWKNNLQPSHLYLSGEFISEESGTNDLAMDRCLAMQPSAGGVLIGVIDTPGPHADRIIELASKTGATVILHTALRNGSGDFVHGLQSLQSYGCRIIVVPFGFDPTEESSNACHTATALILCSVWNYPMNTDLTMDCPSWWASSMRHVIPVSGTDRNGRLYSWVAWGTNTLAAPERNIVACGTYSSGTSYSAPIVACVAALLMAKEPSMTAEQVAWLLRFTSTNLGLTRRINPLVALQRVSMYSPEKTKPYDNPKDRTQCAE